MYFIESERLKLIPLTYQQLLLQAQNPEVLPQILNIQRAPLTLEPTFEAEMLEALQNFWLPNTLLYPDLYYWYTNWYLVEKHRNIAVGGIGFGGYPNDFGETTIGYMLGHEYRGNGYATEALQTLSGWGFSFSILKAIKADTQPGNQPSQRVLERAGFRHTHSDSQLRYYRLQKP
jgi:[ribosomal protein S5]-alanine N-acetyltransferase